MHSLGVHNFQLFIDVIQNLLEFWLDSGTPESISVIPAVKSREFTEWYIQENYKDSIKLCDSNRDS